MTEDEELAHLRAPSRDPQQRNIDYWARRAERAEADNERLRADNELLAAAHGRPSWRAYEAITAKRDELLADNERLRAALNGDDDGGESTTKAD